MGSMRRFRRGTAVRGGLAIAASAVSVVALTGCGASAQAKIVTSSTAVGTPSASAKPEALPAWCRAVGPTITKAYLDETHFEADFDNGVSTAEDKPRVAQDATTLQKYQAVEPDSESTYVGNMVDGLHALATTPYSTTDVPRTFFGQGTVALSLDCEQAGVDVVAKPYQSGK